MGPGRRAENTGMIRDPGPDPVPSGADLAPPAPVEINIAYGTEKAKWLQAALREFEKTPAGARSHINLIGMGSVEGAHAILAGEKPTPIHVWSPASSAYREVFVHEWSVRHGGSPIGRAQDLALTPMVFVLWEKRYDEFVRRYKTVTFRTIGEAMAEPGGWGSIAGKPEWGLFKFGHAHPNQSNSGMLALVLMAYEFAGKHRDLTLADVTRPEFQEWFRSFERALTRHGGKLTHSTGTLMQEMVKRGPSQYDGLLVYENLAVEYMTLAREHWGDDGVLRVVYPDPNIWNDHPYYILDVPWSGPAQRKAAGEFLAFLMTEPIQRLAVADGFRPGNASVSPHYPGSPLSENERHGVRIDAALRLCDPPKADVLNALLSSFQRLEP